VEKAKMIEIMGDEVFLSEVLALKSEIEIEKAFQKRGIYFTVEELEEICDVVDACRSLRGGTVLKNIDEKEISGGGGIDMEFWEMKRIFESTLMHKILGSSMS
jgi:hypothetical protein